jgi:uncharacterized protein
VNRIVADSNVLVSALHFGGKPMALLTLAEEGQIDLAISEAMLTETLGVLRVKFHNTEEQLADREAYLRTVSRIVTPSEAVAVIQSDPTDDRILECAVAAGAETIASGDRHLLSLGSFRGIEIVRVADFLARFSGRSR